MGRGLRLFLGLLAVPIFCAGVFIGGTRRECVNREVASLLSPDGRQRAVTFERDCPWFGEHSTRVSLLRRDAPLDDDDGGTVWAGSHGLKFRLLHSACSAEVLALDLRWLDAHTLQVAYDGRAERWFEASRVGEVEVRCAARPASEAGL